MAGAAVVVVLIGIWLAQKRLEFTWRMSWLAVAFVLLCASGLTAGGKVAGFVANGIFTAVHGAAAFLGDL